jgi:uroporphyrin-III C-methyltransferase
VFLVGAGPGDPELLTLKAYALLRRADVVLHDDLVPCAIVSLAGQRAKVVNVGKRCGAKRISQTEINFLMIEHARLGNAVIRLKSGDPAIFGRLAEETDALADANIPYEIVPGITAALAATASLGVSLTDRRKSSRIVIVSGHRAYADEPHARNDWSGLAHEDATLVVYMPGRNLTALRNKLLDAGLPADIPAVVVSRVTAPQQREWLTTLGKLDSPPPVESPSLLLVGRALERARSSASAENRAPFFDVVEWQSLLALVESEISPEKFDSPLEMDLAP